MRLIAMTVTAALCSPLALAEGKRDLGAHEHGVGSLNIAFDGDAVAIEFEAPGADIVGFEHPAESAEDRARVDAAIAALAKPLELFRLPDAAQCTLVAAEVELHGDEDAHHDEHGDHEHGDAHHDEHAEAHHDEDEHHEDHAEAHHDEGEHHEEHAEASHTEFHAEYRLACASPGAIDRIEFGYFEAFPNAEELEIQMISDKGSHGFEVERANPTLDLGGLI